MLNFIESGIVMKYLDSINFPKDLKKLKKDELVSLAEEIREFLIKSVAKTGGHLASNLGVVELTVALHYCFDFSKDKIVWDVGHQAYTHKILTGRKDKFENLRKKDGLSGFPKGLESDYDAFDTGHSSTSISAGLGLAQARDLLGENYNVVSIIGDGSMTGGLAYEALNNVARNNNKFIIILNDNQMSISKNVGAMSKYLTELRSAPKYIEVKKDVSEILNSLPVLGSKVTKVLEKTKDSIKYALLPSIMFEQLGIKYIGPVDGHNINSLINVLNKVKNFDKPVLIHILTKKGKGYANAEKYPSKYHGVSSFDVDTGVPFLKKTDETYSEVFGRTLCRLSAKNKKIVAVTAAMPLGTGLDFFSKAYPNRFFDVGIAEEHAVTFAAGMAKGGFVPVFAVYSTFLQRSYDQILHDVCIQGLHVVFAVDRAGIVGDDGETHQGIYDLSYLSHIPNMTVIAPKNKFEFEKMIEFAVNKFNGPIAVRYPKGTALNVFENYFEDIIFGKSECIFEGKDIVIIFVGNMSGTALEVYNKLICKGYNPALINARFINPIDLDLIEDIRNNFEYVFTIEDNINSGGFGCKLNSALINSRVFDKKIYNFSFPDVFVKQGSKLEIYKDYGLDSGNIFEKIMSFIGTD